ncbi:MAG: metal-dependent hydrolase [Thermoplasmatales archaeon]|jgi:Predicted Zn-dependent hydrolases of the beta-lactamase fold
MVKLTWYGHAAWMVEFSNKKVLIDPFLKENPKSPIKPEEISKVDYIIVTHSHQDHLGDAYEISKRTGAKIVSIFENILEAEKNGVPEENLLGMNIGSQVEFNGIKIGLTQAVHSANCAGTVITGDGRTIYHAGDTGLFGDMKLIGELYRPDAALLPIGGFFTMSPKEAAVAARLLGAKYVFPMHYATWPIINGDPEELKKALEGTYHVIVLKPGESYII